jgi:hypothetical protein
MMTRNANILIQILALMVNALQYATNIAPEKAKPWIALGILLVQGIVAIVAHSYNPDGTPASEKYDPNAAKPGQFGGIGRAVVLGVLCASMITMQACTPKQLETFKAVSTGVVATANGIQSTIDTLIAQGKLTADEAVFVKKYLGDGIALVGQLNTLIQAVSSWPPKNSGEIVDLAIKIISLIDDGINQGTLKFGNGPVMQKVGLTLAILKGALSTIKSLLGATPVTATRWERFKDKLESPFIRDKLQRQLENTQAQLNQVKVDLDAMAAV